MAHSHLALTGGCLPGVLAVYPHLNQMLTVFSCGLDEIVSLVGTRARVSRSTSPAAGRNLRKFSLEAEQGGMRDGDPAAGPVDQRWAEVGRSRGEGRNGPPATGRQACEALTSRSKCACTQGNRESADKPGSVVGNHPSGACVAARLERPTRKHLRAAGAGPQACAFPYLVLLQVGFAVPSSVATDAVRSYRTLSPLPSPHRCSAWAVCSLLHFPWARAPQALPGTLPCGARTFLREIDAAVAWPTPAGIILGTFSFFRRVTGDILLFRRRQVPLAKKGECPRLPAPAAGEKRRMSPVTPSRR